MSRHLLTVADFEAGEIEQILALAAAPIDSLGRPLDGLGAALIFEKPSNRTRHSTEMAVVQLGGHPIYTRGEEVGFDTREPVEDVAQILAGYHAVIAARVFSHHTLERMAAVVDIPVVNLLSDWSHPLQALRRRPHDDPGPGPARRPDRGLRRRLQQRRPLARRGQPVARRPGAAGLPRWASPRTTPSWTGCG